MPTRFWDGGCLRRADSPRQHVTGNTTAGGATQGALQHGKHICLGGYHAFCRLAKVSTLGYCSLSGKLPCK